MTFPDDLPALPPASTWEGEELLAAVLDAATVDAASSLEGPHVVLVRDPYCDAVRVFGPFDCPVDAAAFAEQHADDLLYDRYEMRVAVAVVPLEGV